MKPFSAPIDDIKFCLNQIAKVDLLPNWDGELCDQVLEVYGKVAEEQLAPINEIGDKQGCKLVDGRVIMPEGFKEVYANYAADGWQGLCIPEEFGGQGMSPTLNSALCEIFSGANHSLEMVVSLVPGAANVLLHHGTKEQQAKYIPRMAAGEWLATMCITEPNAGSDLANTRCKATENGDHWLLNGEKIFISGGDQDLTEGTLHLVLARTAEGGTRGLSLFSCPSLLEDGTRNSVTVERIEEKMGLHASPTCQLHFNNAQAELIGNLNEGLKAMFILMNHARLDVALQGVAHATRAYDIAASYANDRVQGRNAEGQQVTIDQHPIVRDTLDDIAALSIGGRALSFTIMVQHELGTNHDFVNFLTSVAKYFCSEAGIQAAKMAQDVLGGYGYLQEYSVDQTYRDARITAIYEGANPIHATTLITRQLARSQGREAFTAHLQAIATETGCVEIAQAIDEWQAVAENLAQQGYPVINAKDFMELTASVLFMATWASLHHHAAKSPDEQLYRRVGERVLKRYPATISYLAKLITE